MNPGSLHPAPRLQGRYPNRKRGEDKGIGSLIFTSIVLHSDG